MSDSECQKYLAIENLRNLNVLQTKEKFNGKCRQRLFPGVGQKCLPDSLFAIFILELRFKGRAVGYGAKVTPDELRV